MDPITLLIGAGIFVGGMLVGRVTRRAKTAIEKTPRPICTCTHGFGSHENGNRCQSSVKRAISWDEWQNPLHFDWQPCACTSYDGPEPLPRSWVPLELPKEL